MGDFGADTLRDSIETAWALTGNLSKTATASFKNPVKFFAHPQQAQKEVRKAIEVRKINTAEDENIITHPRFEEITDHFRITVRRRLTQVDEVSFDKAEEEAEDMQEEIVRIIKTVYNPLAGTGNFFKMNRQWRFDDVQRLEQPELIRRMDLFLTRLKSQTTEVFQGYNGVLTFDLSASKNMDSAPAGDYVYTEAYDVESEEGSSTISVMTRNSSAKTGKPTKCRGKFSGTFRATMYAKKSDLNGASADKLDNIYKAQANGQHIEAVFLDAALNKEGTPVTLTSSTPCLVTRMRRKRLDEDLVKYTLTADITEPTTTSVA